MMKLNWRAWLAASLGLMTVATLGACNRAQNVPMGQEQGTRQVREEAVQPTQYTEADIKQALSTMQPGQTVSWYGNQFAQMGLNVVDARLSQDEVRYELQHGNNRYRATMRLAPMEAAPMPGQPQGMQAEQPADLAMRQVDGITVTPLHFGWIGQETDPQMSTLVSKLESMPTGKKPIDYIPLISQFGEVTSFDQHEKNADIKFKDAAGREFEVQMDVNRDNNKVTSIDINKEFWHI